MPSRPPSAVVWRMFRQTPRPASLRPILARMPASVSVANQPCSCSTIQTSVDAAASGCQSQFWASRPPGADDAALGQAARAREDLGAGVDRRAARTRPGPRRARSPRSPPRSAALSSTAAPRLGGVRAVGLLEHAAVERERVRDQRRLRPPEGLTARVRRALVGAVDGKRHPATKAATSSWRANHTRGLVLDRGDEVVEQLRPVPAADHLRMHRVGDVPPVLVGGVELPQPRVEERLAAR